MIEKILIVGDLHGDWGKLNQLMTKKQPTMVFQLGDFGWWPKMTRINPVVYGQKPWNHMGLKPHDTIVRWVDGNHEDHEDLDSMGRKNKPEILMYENVIYQPRGSIYELDDGRRVLFMGGADSVDKQVRTPGLDWFYREIPSQDEIDRAMSHERVDIVISHTAPHEWTPNLCKGEKVIDPCRHILSLILNKYKPSLWYNGHWHTAKEGKYGTTKWQSLDYPGHGGRWWTWMD